MTEQFTPPQDPLEYDTVQVSEGTVQHWYKLPGKSIFMFEESEAGTAYAWTTRLTFDQCYEIWESLWAQSSGLEAIGMQKTILGINAYRPTIDTETDVVRKFIDDNRNSRVATNHYSCTWWRKDYSDGTSIKWDTVKYVVAQDSLGAVEFMPGVRADDGFIVDLLRATATQEIVDNVERILDH